MKPTNDTEISVPATWGPIFYDLKSSGFDDDEVASFRHDGRECKHYLAALALKYAHDKMDTGDEAPLAALKATRQWRNSIFLTPADVCTIADHYASYADGWDTVIDEHLREHYNGFPLQYVTEDAREALKRVIKRASEIWVEDPTRLTGLWVFNNPDHKW